MVFIDNEHGTLDRNTLARMCTIHAALKALGKADMWERLGGSLVVDPGKLIGAGWRPRGDPKAGLARLAAASRAAR